ncbi:MAG: hypothetical protein OEM62_02175 [Acidobacteriota bacterium]|nr:hypothetical protein [Acidobacteriota bacterium]
MVLLVVATVAGAVPVTAAVGMGEQFIGTVNNQSFELRVSDARILLMIPDPTSPTIVGGYEGNFVTGGVVGATVSGGGYDSGFPLSPGENRVTDDYGFVGGGRGNVAGNEFGLTTDRTHAVVAGGSNNRAWGSHSFIGGGSANATGTEGISFYDVVAGGTSNQANGGSSAVGGGINNKTRGFFSTIPGGRGAIARLRGQWAYGAGEFNGQTGSAQISIFTLRGETADATPIALLIDASDKLLIPSDQTWTLEITVVARSLTGVSAGYRLEGVVENNAGTTALLGSTKTELYEDAAAWDVALSANDTATTLGEVVVTVTGDGNSDVRWVAKVETVEVDY